MTRHALALALLMGSSSVAAQERTPQLALPAAPAASVQQGRTSVHATLLGIGRVRQLDTYLSPLQYRGPQLQLMHETLRRTRWAHGNVTFQTLWHGDLAYTGNDPDNVHTLGADINYDAALHYHLIGAAPPLPAGPRATPPAPRFRLLAGPQIGTTLGVLYNTRNGNNPAQALASLRLSASVAAVCDFRLRRQPLSARYQLDLPLVGLMFSPAYGQSYYEIFSLGHTDHNIRLTHPLNAFTSRHLLSVDIPLRPFTLRAAYLCDIRQSHVNDIRHHSYTHAFMLGWVRRLVILK